MPRVFQRDLQRAVAAHAVSGDAAPLADGVVLFEVGGQFLHDVVVHPVVRCPRCAGGVHIEARALAEVVAGVVGDIRAARRGVRHDQGETVFGGVALRPGFGRKVFVGAGEAGEPVEQRYARTRQCLRRQVETVSHGAGGAVGVVAVAPLFAAECLVAGEQLRRVHAASP